MKRLFFLAILLFLLTIGVSAQNKKCEIVGGKITLPMLYLDNPQIQFAVSDIDGFIRRRKKGFNWPMTKIIFTQKGVNLFFEVVAIDNGWAKMIEKGDEPRGYILVNGRMFIVMTKVGEEDIDMGKYFVMGEEEDTKSFSLSNHPPLGNNPRWVYEYRNDYPIIKESRNIEILGR